MFCVQVIVFAVNKAWLLLQPYELPDLDEAFAADFAPTLGSVTSSSSHLSPAALALWTQVGAS